MIWTRTSGRRARCCALRCSAPMTASPWAGGVAPSKPGCGEPGPSGDSALAEEIVRRSSWLQRPIRHPYLNEVSQKIAQYSHHVIHTTCGQPLYGTGQCDESRHQGALQITQTLPELILVKDEGRGEVETMKLRPQILELTWTWSSPPVWYWENGLPFGAMPSTSILVQGSMPLAEENRRAGGTWVL